MSRQVVLVDSSHFVDRDPVANGRGAVCDVAKVSVQITENELSAAACYSNHEKYSFGSAIFDYSRIFEHFVSTLVLTVASSLPFDKKLCLLSFSTLVMGKPRSHV